MASILPKSAVQKKTKAGSLDNCRQPEKLEWLTYPYSCCPHSSRQGQNPPLWLDFILMLLEAIITIELWNAEGIHNFTTYLQNTANVWTDRQ